RGGQGRGGGVPEGESAQAAGPGRHGEDDRGDRRGAGGDGVSNPQRQGGPRMSQDYDPTVKALVELDPASWLPFAGRAAAPVTVISAEVTALLSAAADTFLRVHADPKYVLHLDFQSGHDSSQLPPRLR